MKWSLKGYIELVYRNAPTKNKEFQSVECLLFSLTGDSVYAAVQCFGSPRWRIIAWDVLTGEMKGKKEFESHSFCKLVALKEGILMATWSTLELWNFDLSVCMRRWRFGADHVYPISDDQVACITFETRQGIILDTVGGDTVKTFKLPRGELIACYGTFQLFAWPRRNPEFIEMWQLGKTEPLWRARQAARFTDLRGSFSPNGQFIVLDIISTRNAYVRDAVSGNVCLELSGLAIHKSCQFISDEEFVFVEYNHRRDGRLKMFNLRSGDLLSVMDVEWDFPFPLATCPRMGLIAIRPRKQFHLEIIKVKHPREETLITETKSFKLQE